jgi:hypothetical protein
MDLDPPLLTSLRADPPFKLKENSARRVQSTNGFKLICRLTPSFQMVVLKNVFLKTFPRFIKNQTDRLSSNSHKNCFWSYLFIVAMETLISINLPSIKVFIQA